MHLSSSLIVNVSLSTKVSCLLCIELLLNATLRQFRVWIDESLYIPHVFELVSLNSYKLNSVVWEHKYCLYVNKPVIWSVFCPP